MQRITMRSIALTLLIAQSISLTAMHQDHKNLLELVPQKLTLKEYAVEGNADFSQEIFKKQFTEHASYQQLKKNLSQNTQGTGQIKKELKNRSLEHFEAGLGAAQFIPLCFFAFVPRIVFSLTDSPTLTVLSTIPNVYFAWKSWKNWTSVKGALKCNGKAAVALKALQELEMKTHQN